MGSKCSRNKQMRSFLDKIMGDKQKNQQRATVPLPSETPKSVFSSHLTSVFHANASSKDAAGNSILTADDVTRKLFSDNPVVGRLIFNYLRGSESQDALGVNLHKFQSSTEQLLTQGTDIRLAEFYFSVFAAEKSEMAVSDLQTMLYECHHADWLNLGVSVPSSLSDNRDSVIDAMANNLMKRDGTAVNRDKLLQWCTSCCPRILNGLHSNICSHLTEERGATSSPSVLPSVGDKSLLSSCQGGHSIATLSIVWQLSCFLPAVYFPDVTYDHTVALTNLLKATHQNGWQVIYDSGSQGLSTNRFLHHVMDYRGCTVMLISFDKFVFVAAVDCDWRQSSQLWGGINCSLLQFQPEFSVVTSGPGIIYFNISDRTAPKGIQLGKDRLTSLKVNGDFEKVTFYGVEYRLKAIEVWGVGGQSARDAQLKHKAWEQQDIKRQQNRKLVPEEWKNNTDRQILEMAGVTTDHNQRSDL